MQRCINSRRRKACPRAIIRSHRLTLKLENADRVIPTALPPSSLPLLLSKVFLSLSSLSRSLLRCKKSLPGSAWTDTRRRRDQPRGYLSRNKEGKLRARSYEDARRHSRSSARSPLMRNASATSL